MMLGNMWGEIEMYIFLSAIVSMFIGFYSASYFYRPEDPSNLPNIITIVVMGCFILYDNKRKHK